MGEHRNVENDGHTAPNREKKDLRRSSVAFGGSPPTNTFLLCGVQERRGAVSASEGSNQNSVSATSPPYLLLGG